MGTLAPRCSWYNTLSMACPDCIGAVRALAVRSEKRELGRIVSRCTFWGTSPAASARRMSWLVARRFWIRGVFTTPRLVTRGWRWQRSLLHLRCLAMQYLIVFPVVQSLLWPGPTCTGSGCGVAIFVCQPASRPQLCAQARVAWA